MSSKEIKLIRERLRETMSNPIINLFYSKEEGSGKGSKEWTNLTKIQLETLIIDIITDEINPNIGYLERGKVRGVTKRSFYRTLEQARLNLIRAMFTIMISGVLNIIDSPRLSDFNALSQNFVDLININNQDNQTPEEKEKWIKLYTKMIFENTQNLKKQTALSKPK
ncbi:MAG: hypothetical protein ACTSQK_01035 [Candidatus Heimdallarchaeota archaeon]